MRRDVAAGAVSAGPQRAFDHGGHRALAFGAGDDDRGNRAIGVAETRHEAANLIEPELDAEQFQRGQVGPGRRVWNVVHALEGSPKRMRSVRASVAFSARRSTTASRKPFSSRNSLR